MSLTLTPLHYIPIIHQGDDLVELVLSSLEKTMVTLKDQDILVFAQKIISKSEGRAVNLVTVTPSQRAIELGSQIDKDPRLVELVLRESREVLRTRPGTIIVEHKLGFVCANAGIDHSNVAGTGDSKEEWVLLLPKNPDRSADELRKGIQARTGKHIGVLVIDSHGRAWRNGTVGVAIGLAGLPGVEDLRGHPDLFDFKLRITQVGVAD
jgi:coenzyme F420-0:L-glutamate ligase / coenzyme F420-1:gamma-L-glutamate ligase